MENIYTEQNIIKFFEGFKTLQNAYNIEKVHLLLNIPNAKATHKVNFHFKNLNLLRKNGSYPEMEILGCDNLLLLQLLMSSTRASPTTRSPYW